jgi:Flp pilus assembly protein TadB
MFSGIENDWFAYLTYSGIALGMLLAVTGALHLASRSETRGEAKSRRMKMIAQGRNTEELLALLKPAPRSGIAAHLPQALDLARQLHRAGIPISPDRFVALCASLGVGGFVLSFAALGLLQAVAVAMVVGVALPALVVRFRAKDRMTKLTGQLPDALDMLARGLKIGHPLNMTIGAVAEEMPDPIGTEFGLIFDQVTYGDDLPDAVLDFADRVGIEDVDYLAASIGIQHGTGGDLARVLEVLGRTIRGRIALRRKIKAISAEGRASAWFLSALPFVMFGFTNFISPGYFGEVADDPLFKPMAAIVLLLVVLNGLILRKLVTFRI